MMVLLFFHYSFSTYFVRESSNLKGKAEGFIRNTSDWDLWIYEPNHPYRCSLIRSFNNNNKKTFWQYFWQLLLIDVL